MIHDIASFDENLSYSYALYCIQHGTLEEFVHYYYRSVEKRGHRRIATADSYVTSFQWQCFVYAVQCKNMAVIDWMISSKKADPYEYDEETGEFLCVCHELLSSTIALDVWNLFFKYEKLETKWTWTLDHSILHLLRFPPEGGTEQLREFIDKWGIDINQQDRDGNTSFMWAFRSQRYQYALQLLACGADETITNSYKLSWRVWCPPLKDPDLYEMNLSAQATIEYILAQDLI